MNRIRQWLRPANRPVTRNCIELFYWQPKSGGHNFGDHLSLIVVSQLLARHQRCLDESVEKARRLLAVGSILHFARDEDTIWGSGVNGKVKEHEHQFSRLDVRAVRGPLTRKFLLERDIYAPEVYGDPVLLLPHLFAPRFRISPKKDYAIVPNLHDLALVKKEGDVISPLLPWNVVVDRILECNFIISSSLHGLIVAEAFGIPACYVRLRETEALLKFEDYYQGTGRSCIPVAGSFAEAKSMGGMPPIIFDAQGLLDAFPLDLWVGAGACR